MLELALLCSVLLALFKGITEYRVPLWLLSIVALLVVAISCG